MLFDNNCFSRLYSYTETKEISQIENYTTELFVFTWKYLIWKKDPLAKDLFMFFGLEDLLKAGIENIKIETQQTYYFSDLVNSRLIPVNGDSIRPDIQISVSNNELFFIEVKVDSPLNQYELKNGNYIDQLTLYSNIRNCKKVCSLTKHFLNKSNFMNHRWYQIANILSKKDNNDFVIQNFLKYLEENEMGKTDSVSGGILNIEKDKENLRKIILEAAERSNLQINSSNLTRELKYEYIYFTAIKRSFAIGVMYEGSMANNIFMWDSNLSDSIFEENPLWAGNWGNGRFCPISLPLESVVTQKSYEEQIEVVYNWIEEIKRKYVDIK